MKTTEQKVFDILKEIEGESSPYRIPDNSKKSMQQIIDIMLKSNTNEKIDDYNFESQKIINTASMFSFDMDELEKWKNRNNECFEIHSHSAVRSNRKIVGKLIVFGKKVVRRCLKWYIDPVVEQQNKFNGSATASINALYNNEIVTQNYINESLKSIKDLSSEQDSLELEISETNKKLKDYVVNKIEISNSELKEYIVNKDEVYRNSVKETINILKEEIEKQKFENDHIRSEVENLLIENLTLKKELLNSLKIVEDKQNDCEKRIKMIVSSVETELDYLNFQLYKRDKKDIRIETKPKTQIVNIDENNNPYAEIDYFKFENSFRGTRDDIKNRQKKYVKYFEGKSNILDIGCGRGEFLEVLKENSITAVGVEAYKEYADYCEYKGINVINKDGILYLKEQEENSKGGIVAFQVVEHMTVGQIVSLCNEAYRVLENNSYLILETPNPTCLSIYTNWFYVDPSHIKPVHPKTLEYLLKEAGFKEIDVLFTDDSKVEYRLPLLNGSNIENLKEFNDGINFLSDIIFGSQDYAIIAKK